MKKKAPILDPQGRKLIVGLIAIDEEDNLELLDFTFAPWLVHQLFHFFTAERHKERCSCEGKPWKVGDSLLGKEPQAEDDPA